SHRHTHTHLPPCDFFQDSAVVSSSLVGEMEKGGGKGFSTPSRPSKRATLVDSEDSDELDFSSKTSSKSEGPLYKGNWSKGGKGDKVPNGAGKAKVTKEPAPPQLSFDPSELPKDAKCLMNCEASQILEGIQDQMVQLSKDPTVKLPVSFDEGLQYAKAGARYTNPQSVRRILGTLKKYGLSEAEICVIGNAFPETADEVFSLLPSLKSKATSLRGPLGGALNELAELRRPA
ncbi:hypothetical protein Tsubulata_014861, partial [Turnera subulata]